MTMIKLSTKGRYGTRIMLELALHHGKGPLLLKEIAKNQEVSVGYLEQIMPSLKSKGLVRANRGAHGGYFLAKDPSDILMKDIVSALEGELFLAECISNPKVCQRYPRCAARDFWKELNYEMSRFLESRSLQDLLDRQQEKDQEVGPEYEI
jgi:Rrf2 family transcriptional regulator, cysteine metabolism repressor